MSRMPAFLQRTAVFVKGAAIAAVLACTPLAPASAHHSYSMFDKNKPLTISGVVSRVEWKNPHTYFVVDAPAPDGKMQRYLLEGSSPNELIRWGWKPNTIKVGDKVTVDLYLLRDGRPGGLFFKLTTAAGAVFHAH
ncbi:MAG: DUF6152 family protein [Pseudomonadota bacterium]